MGIWQNFKCDSCGYAAQVSGGADCGFDVRTVTILCSECRELMDVVVGTPLETEATALRRRPQCSRGPAHRVRLWEAPGPCPRCGTAMTAGAVVALWD